MTTRLDFNQIPQFPKAHYQIDVEWRRLEQQLAGWGEDFQVELDPDFQREHVWTQAQQVAYIEYVLMGGEVAKEITWNCPGWDKMLVIPNSMQLVDGKQRLEAARAFMRGDLAIFGGRYLKDFTGHLRYYAGFKFKVCSLEKREDILQLYLNINAGGTPHTAAEINRVRALLEEERK